MVMFDPNMNIALNLARALANQQLQLPAALRDPSSRAKFLIEIDKPLLVDIDGAAQWDEFGAHLRKIAELSKDLMPELDIELERVAVALSLWAGCIMAAKTIGHETRSGMNTVAGREQAFALIDRLAAEDALFCAGVEAAPAFKVCRGEEYSFEGVPESSPVRRHIEPARG
jgi:hypothetical protein